MHDVTAVARELTYVVYTLSLITAIEQTPRHTLCVCRVVEHSNSGKKSFDSILVTESIFFDSSRFGNLINLPFIY